MEDGALWWRMEGRSRASALARTSMVVECMTFGALARNHTARVQYLINRIGMQHGIQETWSPPYKKESWSHEERPSRTKKEEKKKR